MITYEQTLLEKKEKLEKILEEEMDKLVIAERLAEEELGEEKEMWQREVEERGLIIEALQDKIEGIDEYLREKSYETEN